MVELITLLVFASFLVVPLVLTTWLLMYATRATASVGTCRQCGYDLHHLGESRRCPECGRPFRLDPRGDPIS